MGVEEEVAGNGLCMRFGSEGDSMIEKEAE